MAHLEFEEDVEDLITESLEYQKEEIGELVANKMRNNVDFFIRLYGGEELEVLSEDLTPVEKRGDSYVFKIDHPAAFIHEFGSTMESVRAKQARSYAFGWSDEDINRVYKTLPQDKIQSIIPSKGFIRSAAIFTKKQMED